MTFHDKMPVLLLEDMEDITKTGNTSNFQLSIKQLIQALIQTPWWYCDEDRELAASG
jgi:hypothetical protein